MVGAESNGHSSSSRTETGDELLNGWYAHALLLKARRLPTRFSISGSGRPQICLATRRGVLAEYIIGTALGILKNVRIEWAEYDLLTHEGIKLEIKSAAYLQSWSQKRLSKISFGIEPKMPQTLLPVQTTEQLLRRQAAVYIFCLLHHRDMLTVNPLSLDQWTFYCLATKKIDAECRDQKTLSLSGLQSLGPLVASYGELAKQVKKLGIIDQGQPTRS